MAAPLNHGPGVPMEIGDQANFPSGWRYLVPDKWKASCTHASVAIEGSLAACRACGLIAFECGTAQHIIAERRKLKAVTAS